MMRISAKSFYLALLVAASATLAMPAAFAQESGFTISSSVNAANLKVAKNETDKAADERPIDKLSLDHALGASQPARSAEIEKSERREHVGNFPPPASGVGRPVMGKASPPSIVTVAHGSTTTIEVSDSEPNLISTPFLKPKVVDRDRAAQATLLGSDVFVTPGRPTTIFIKDGAQRNSPVIGLHLIPVRAPAHAVSLVLDGGIPAERRDTADWANKPNDYVDNIRASLKQAVMGEVPIGYTEAPLTAPMAVSGSVYAEPVKRYAGTDADIYRYRLTNKGAAAVTLSEEAFGSERVLAVTLYPKIALGAGDSTEVFIMFAKEGM
jgi:conjugal transfer pilus assembly protein TraK